MHMIHIYIVIINYNWKYNKPPFYFMDFNPNITLILILIWYMQLIYNSTLYIQPTQVASQTPSYHMHRSLSSVTKDGAQKIKLKLEFLSRGFKHRIVEEFSNLDSANSTNIYM